MGTNQSATALPALQEALETNKTPKRSIYLIPSLGKLILEGDIATSKHDGHDRGAALSKELLNSLDEHVQ